MTGRRFFFIIIIFIVSQPAFTARIMVRASNEPLSSVIKRLGAEVSFDNRILSGYHITLHKSFPSTDAALRYMLRGKPLQVSRVSGVYVITAKAVAERRTTHKSVGRYAVKAVPDTLGMNLSMSLKEIVITARSRTPQMKGDDASGTTHLSSLTANVMPGYSDNSVFNILRMMPGIRASGEPSDELYVWGSSPGESRVTLDGIPLFSMQSYDSNISYINPYMSDEVKYKRGIISASDGSQTGAKVEVTSGAAQITKPVVKAMASTMSANIFAAVPIGSHCVVSAAYRHTLESVFGGTTFDAYRKKNNMSQSNSNRVNVPQTENTPSSSPSAVAPQRSSATTSAGSSTDNTASGNSTGLTSSSSDPYTPEASADSSASTTTTITPKYQFQDFNMNVTGVAFGNTTYKLSMYGAKDYLNYDSSDTLTTKGDQTSYQGGVSADVSREWHNGNKSELSAFFSGLRTEQNGDYTTGMSKFNYLTTEKVTELNIKYLQSGIGALSGLSVGGEMTTYRVSGTSVDKRLTQPTLFATDKFDVGRLNVEAGLRTDFMENGVKWQPRALLKYALLRYFTLTSSWGMYNQYLVKNPFSIFEGSYQFKWDLNTSLMCYNTVAGISYERGGLNVSVEGYVKKTHHSKWVVNGVLGEYDFTLKGLDVSAKYNWSRGLFFASWSLSDDPRQTNGVAHEIKAGGVMRFYPFTVSANYVFGHGYNSMLLPASSFTAQQPETTETSSQSSTTTYSRMDLYASYEKKFKYVALTVGASLINVFDTSNQKYVTSWIPRSESTSFLSQAARFTPLVFLEIKY